MEASNSESDGDHESTVINKYEKVNSKDEKVGPKRKRLSASRRRRFKEFRAQGMGYEKALKKCLEEVPLGNERIDSTNKRNRSLNSNLTHKERKKRRMEVDDDGYGSANNGNGNSTKLASFQKSSLKLRCHRREWKLFKVI